MDVNRIYLLIIIVLSPNVSRMSPRMKCNPLLLELYVKRTSDMKRIAAQCNQSESSAVVTLPNVEMKVATWQNMTESQQSGEVLSHLRLLSDASQKSNDSYCISRQLQKLNHNIQHIVGLINYFMKNGTSLHLDVSLLPSSNLHTTTSNSTEIFHRFLKLLQGKVTILLKRLRKDSCR